MNTLEDRLRDAFRADAATVRPESIPPGPPPRPARKAPGRPGSRRIRVLIPLAAAAAIIAIVAGLSLAVPQRGGSLPGPGPSAPPTGQSPAAAGPPPMPTLAANASQGVPTSAPTPGVPRFYVTVYVAPAGGEDYIVVRDTATGKVTGRINPPASAGFAGLSATAGDRTFIMAIQPNSGCISQLYQFRLNNQGQPGPLVPLHVTLPGIFSETGNLAITPDGRMIGYATYDCNGAGEVGVINLATRQARVWGYTGQQTPMGLSLPADGRWLGYTILSPGGGRRPGGSNLPGGARILQTSAPAGPLFQRSRIVSRTSLWGALTSDGASMYYCAVSPYHGAALPNVGKVAYGIMSVAGGPERVIAKWTSVPYPQCWASLDPAGNYLLVQFPTTVPGASDWSRPAILDLRTGKLTDINAPAFYGPFDIAW
jgi:hypothetical protein